MTVFELRPLASVSTALLTEPQPCPGEILFEGLTYTALPYVLKLRRKIMLQRSAGNFRPANQNAQNQCGLNLRSIDQVLKMTLAVEIAMTLLLD